MIIYILNILHKSINMKLNKNETAVNGYSLMNDARYISCFAGIKKSNTIEEINSKLGFDSNESGLIVCKIKDNSNKIKMINVFNGSLNEQEVSLPDEDIWGIYVNESKASNKTIDEVRGNIIVPRISAISLIRN